MARARLLEIGREQGPCALCGAPFARHRLWDAIDGGLRHDGLIATLWDYEPITVTEAVLVRVAFADARRRHLSLPGRTAA